jgi:hypothetical protein
MLDAKKLAEGNIVAKIDGNVLTLTIALDKPLGPTGTGANIMLAKTGKAIAVPTAQGEVLLAVNLYRNARSQDEYIACSKRALAVRVEKANKEAADAAVAAAMAAPAVGQNIPADARK